MPILQLVSRCRGFLLAWAFAFCAIATTAGREPERVAFFVRRADPFVCEDPILTLRVAPPWDADTKVPLPKYLPIYLGIQVTDAQGKRAGGGYPKFVPVTPHESHFFSLPAGVTAEIPTGATVAQIEPGEYTIRATLRPTLDRKLSFERKVAVKWRPLRDEDIVKTWPVPAPPPDNPELSKVDLITVRDVDGCWLFHRELSPRGVLVRLHRLWQVDKDTAINVTLENVHEPLPPDGYMRIRFVQMGKGFEGRVHYSVGYVDQEPRPIQDH